MVSTLLWCITVNYLEEIFAKAELSRFSGVTHRRNPLFWHKATSHTGEHGRTSCFAIFFTPNATLILMNEQATLKDQHTEVNFAILIRARHHQDTSWLALLALLPLRVLGLLNWCSLCWRLVCNISRTSVPHHLLFLPWPLHHWKIILVWHWGSLVVSACPPHSLPVPLLLPSLPLSISQKVIQQTTKQDQTQFGLHLLHPGGMRLSIFIECYCYLNRGQHQTVTWSSQWHGYWRLHHVHKAWAGIWICSDKIFLLLSLAILYFDHGYESIFGI